MKDSALPNANIYHLRILFIDVCVSGNSVKKRYILSKNMAKISFGKSCVIGGHLH